MDFGPPLLVVETPQSGWIPVQNHSLEEKDPKFLQRLPYDTAYLIMDRGQTTYRVDGRRSHCRP
jgi:hypothetical protein